MFTFNFRTSTFWGKISRWLDMCVANQPINHPGRSPANKSYSWPAKKKFFLHCTPLHFIYMNQVTMRFPRVLWWLGLALGFFLWESFVCVCVFVWQLSRLSQWGSQYVLRPWLNQPHIHTLFPRMESLKKSQPQPSSASRCCSNSVKDASLYLERRPTVVVR